MAVIPNLNLDLSRQRAILFVCAKGRLPNTREELLEWLLEFEDHMIKLADAILAQHQEHMNVCTRQIAYVIPLGPSKP